MFKYIEKALRGSEKKWDDIYNETGVDEGGDNCPLCLELMKKREKGMSRKSCVGFCPVANHTQKESCSETPYKEWELHQRRAHNVGVFDTKEVECETCKSLAKEERDFLRSLFPTNGK